MMGILSLLSAKGREMIPRPQHFKAHGIHSGYWLLQGPGILVEDLEDIFLTIPAKTQYLITVVGKPFYVSPDWDQKHSGEQGGNYDYASSYAIPAREIGRLLIENEEETAETFFNAYLDSEETTKGWEEIRQIKIVDQEKWKYLGG